MKTLLKDMPEHMERIENNFEVRQLVKDAIDEATMHNKSEEILPDLIISKLTEFVNQNYEWKGVKS